MRLLQLNTWTLRLAKNIKDMVDQEAPDIMCLQEVMDADGDIVFFQTLREFQETSRYHIRHYSPTASFPMMDVNVAFGNAIISNFELSDKDTVFTAGEYTEKFSFSKNDYNIRNFQHAVVMENDIPVHILNHHGFHINQHKNGDEHTLKACREIAEYIAKLEGPVILTGDFNLVPTSESIELLTSKLRNLSVEYGLETTRNNLTRKQEVCDYIFVNDKVNVENFYMSDIIASDHNGLVLDFNV